MLRTNESRMKRPSDECFLDELTDTPIFCQGGKPPPSPKNTQMQRATTRQNFRPMTCQRQKNAEDLILTKVRMANSPFTPHAWGILTTGIIANNRLPKQNLIVKQQINNALDGNRRISYRPYSITATNYGVIGEKKSQSCSTEIPSSVRVINP